MIDGLTGTYA